MPLSKAHKERSRQRILDAATELFVAHGYEGVGINTIMEAAELTRGAFYAHFESKAQLFTIVVGREPEVLRRLKARGDRYTHHLVDGAIEVLDELMKGATEEGDTDLGSLSALTNDTARADIEARLSFAQRLGETADELMRGFQSDRPAADPRALAVVSLLVGATQLARASRPDPVSGDVVDACRSLADAILRGEVSWPDRE